MSYQCLEKCGEYLVAARDSNIDLFRLDDGSLLSTWSCPSIQDSLQNGKRLEDSTKALAPEQSKAAVAVVVESSAPPAKRRKLSTEEDETRPDAEEESQEKYKEPEKGKEQKKKQKKNNRANAASSSRENPVVIALAVTTDAKHVMVITGEDKSIRVLEVLKQDRVPTLKQLSHRPVFSPISLQP
jgi:tRNA (guanine-N(7)-)-methyltransferase subunit TRM82